MNPLRLLLEVDVANTAKLDAKNVQLAYEFRYNGNVVGRELIYCGIITAQDVRSREKTVFISLSDSLFVKFRENPSGLTMHLVDIRVG
jgi:predicted  nucleic acid-binding Zn ribbon protein